jgi:hypothetical protein
MKKTNTVRVNGNMIFKGHKLTEGDSVYEMPPNICENS